MNYLNQLKKILEYTQWSQGELAQKLEVSFPTLNSWLNQRSTPREKAKKNIDVLFIDIVGSSSVDLKNLTRLKKQVLSFKLSAKDLINDEELLKKLTLHLTYHTNNIEGSTMTLADVEGVLFENKALTNRTAIEQAEARNHQATLHWLIDEVADKGSRFSINQELINSIHLRLMNGIISDAGRYRRHGVRIMGSRVATSNWQRIPQHLGELMAIDANRTDLITEIAYFHARFEKIHPFSDGNGRTGRLLMLAQALESGTTPPLVAKERKKAYYKYLEIAQTSENYLPLELFIAESIDYSHSILN